MLFSPICYFGTTYVPLHFVSLNAEVKIPHAGRGRIVLDNQQHGCDENL